MVVPLKTRLLRHNFFTQSYSKERNITKTEEKAELKKTGRGAAMILQYKQNNKVVKAKEKGKVSRESS